MALTRRYYFSENKAPAKANSVTVHVDPLIDGFGEYAIHSFVINDMHISFRDLSR